MGCVGTGSFRGFSGLESGVNLGFFGFDRESAFGGFAGFVCCFGCCVVSDFLRFWIFWALSQCAVRGLYGVASN